MKPASRLMGISLKTQALNLQSGTVTLKHLLNSFSTHRTEKKKCFSREWRQQLQAWGKGSRLAERSWINYVFPFCLNMCRAFCLKSIDRADCVSLQREKGK